MTKKSTIYILCALSTAALAGCGAGEASVGDVTESETLMPVEVVLPETMDIYETLTTTATLESDAEAAVMARAAGEVVEILVEEGDRVEEGQELARLDGERLRLQMLQARASLDMTSREYERFVSLRQRGLVSASAVEGLKFDVDALRATYELMRLNYDYTKIRAPISGVVSSRDVKVGTHVDAGTPVFSITDTSQLVAYLHIPQVELPRIKAGDEVLVQVDAMPAHEFRARLARISPTIDARNGTFRATVYVDNNDRFLAPGMFSRFGINFEKHADALVVPTRALVEEDGVHVVYVVDDGSAVRRVVQIGIASGGVTEILAGLGSGDSVVVTGQASLRDGSKVLASLAGDASDHGTG